MRAVTRVLAVLVLTLLMLMSGRTAAAGDINLCGDSGSSRAGDLSRLSRRFLLYTNRNTSSVHGALVFVVEDGVFQAAHGALNIQDGTSNTIAFAESLSATMTCADTDGDGIAGISLIAFDLVKLETGEIVPVRVVPDDDELEPGDAEDVTLYIGEEGPANINPFRIRWLHVPER